MPWFTVTYEVEADTTEAALELVAATYDQPKDILMEDAEDDE